MLVKKRHNEIENIDALKIFFQDVAAIPIVNGKKDYLPLTRRVHRGVILQGLIVDNIEATYLNLLKAVVNRQTLLTNLVPIDVQNTIKINSLSIDFEEFLDDPTASIPSSIMQFVDSLKGYNPSNEVEEAIWEVFYLLSLVPFQQRNQFPNICIDRDFNVYLARIQEEAQEAKNRLVVGTLRWVIKIAKLYVGRGLPFLDLFQEGVFGLIRATETFNERDGHFQPYAATWIRQKITRAILETGSAIRVPVHEKEKLAGIGPAIDSFSETLGRLPTEYEIVQELNLFSNNFNCENEDIENLDLDGELIENIEKFAINTVNPNNNLRKAREHLNNYRMFAQPAILLDHPSLYSRFNRHADRKQYRFDLSETLVDPTDLEELVYQKSLRGILLGEIKNLIDARDFEVLMIRFGINDGEERTLEEVSRVFGLTRERIRQIEGRALKDIKRGRNYSKSLELKGLLTVDHRPSISSIADQQLKRLYCAFAQYLEDIFIEDENIVANESATIDHLIKSYITLGRRSRLNAGRSSRSILLKEVLEEIGKPTHYVTIYKNAMQRLPEESRFPIDSAYNTMFYSDLFRSYGAGIFGLSAQETFAYSIYGEVVLQHCPIPFLPGNPYPNAFFDSIMLGRDLLLKQTLSAERFWIEMQAWAQRNSSSFQDRQDAFDAWYAVGLIDRIDFMSEKEALVKLLLPTQAKLKEIREFCLNTLCRRILKMPELLLTLTRIPRPTLPIIQKALFGSERAGFDVSIRLILLASFGAVQQVGDEWRLTDIGRCVLVANPAQVLPDFSEVEILAEDDSVDAQIDCDYEEFGLLDL
jgi:RNA polymerase sigma factor (sigma-70 family)